VGRVESERNFLGYARDEMHARHLVKRATLQMQVLYLLATDAGFF
jgi:hypothetical protein